MTNDPRGLEKSALNQVIEPEIIADGLFEIIRHLAATEALATVLEIGSSSGDGSTAALVAGLSRNSGAPKLFCIEVSRPRFNLLREAYKHFDFVHCYNGSTVSAGQFPSAETVAAFYHDVDSNLRKFPLPLVLDWLRQDIQYVREAGVEAGMIEKIKAEHEIETFDMVLIDGSEFTGEAEFSLIQGAGLILLDDTTTFKCHAVRRTLLDDPMYDLVADDPDLRNGYSVFRRRAAARRMGDALPIHFFTIVLNGMPFIRYHADVFQRLTVPWHWHIVEGVAALRHDTAWSVANGGHVPEGMHDRGHSNDGTTAYLDRLAQRFPENVTVHRKPLGEFWDGKKAMVNAPLANIGETCLLWQVDSDELWTAAQIETVHGLFTRNPTRTAAYYWCWYYVGPGKIISTRHNYAQNPRQEWLRTWRYQPGAVWAAHEPPILTVGDTDTAAINPFTQNEMEAAGAVFQHFAYATEDQVAFKEQYYGYRDARTQWRSLQTHMGSGALRDYFGWVSDNAMFDDAAHYLIDPIARPDPATGDWTFDGTQSETQTRRPRIVVDGIVWQYPSSSRRRIWENLLREWVASGFAEHVILLDRAGTAPRIPGVHYQTIASHEYGQTGRDSLYLETICRRLSADLFVSTLYSAPTATPSFFIGHDMIPAVPPEDEVGREKRRAIHHASAHGVTSARSARELAKMYPSIAGGSIHVVNVGAGADFTPPPPEVVESFRKRHGLRRRPYVLMAGERIDRDGFKNALLVFRALAGMPADHPVTLVCLGGQPDIEPRLRALAPKLDVRRLALDAAELPAACAGAHALLSPSKHASLPPLEAMACGTPVIVCRNDLCLEMVGDAAIAVDPDDPTEMTGAILKLFDPATRADLIQRGSRHAARFTSADMAARTSRAFLETCDRLRSGAILGPNTTWTELREFQQSCQASGIDPTRLPPRTAPRPPPAIARHGWLRKMRALTARVLKRILRRIDWRMRRKPSHA